MIKECYMKIYPDIVLSVNILGMTLRDANGPHKGKRMGMMLGRTLERINMLHPPITAMIRRVRGKLLLWQNKKRARRILSI